MAGAILPRPHPGGNTTGAAAMSSFIRLLAGSVATLLMPFALAAATPEAPARIALIIANSNYPTAGDSLPGAARDANTLEQTLKDASLGFRVTVSRNKGKREIEAA